VATIDISVPVTPALAERLRDPERRARLGALLSVVSAPGVTDAEIGEAVRLFRASEPARLEALAETLAEMRGVARDNGLTAEAVEAELMAWRQERSSAGPRRR